MCKQLVAVYGSLKSGFHNHRLLEKSKKVGEQQVEGWEMYSLGGFPAVVPSSNFNDKVSVEVYSVDDETFKNLDRLEGYPHFYDRIKVKTQQGDAWMYYFQYPPNDNKVEDGNWML